MTLWSVAARNVLRNRFRTMLTIVASAVSIIAFVLLRTVVAEWNSVAENAAQDRLTTRQKVSFVIPLPRRYIDEVRTKVPGIKVASYATYFGAKWPRDPTFFFGNVAVDDQYFDLFPEMVIEPKQLAAWQANKKGAVLGDKLAQKLGLSVGDKFTMSGTLYPGNWEFVVEALYTTRGKTPIDRMEMMFHWSYLNDALPPSRQGLVGWIVSQVQDPARSAAISAQVDLLFDERDQQTVTMSEGALTRGYMATVSAVLTAMDIVSFIVLLIMMMVLGNTIAMGVRERTTEYGVLRALGFLPHHIRVFIVGEAITVGIVAGVGGVALSYPIVQIGVGQYLHENMGNIFPSLQIRTGTMIMAFCASVALGVIASLIPAMRASKLSVIDALRRVA